MNPRPSTYLPATMNAQQSTSRRASSPAPLSAHSAHDANPLAGPAHNAPPSAPLTSFPTFLTDPSTLAPLPHTVPDPDPWDWPNGGGAGMDFTDFAFYDGAGGLDFGEEREEERGEEEKGGENGTEAEKEPQKEPENDAPTETPAPKDKDVVPEPAKPPLKRKAESGPSSTSASASPAKRPSLGRGSGQGGRAMLTRSQAARDGGDKKEEAGKERARQRPRIVIEAARGLAGLPAGKSFPIQIGSEMFRLSGASISSDAPSYFSHYFAEQLLLTGGKTSVVKTLYIDRDPATFRDIALHLQGYHVRPRDEEHFVRLFADAQFYSLPRLTQQLFKSEIYIRIGPRAFQIPREIFASPGDSPNFFTLGFAHFFSTPNDSFPGLDRGSLLRPPSIMPPNIPTRDPGVFAQLLQLLQGYEVPITSPEHRGMLLRDARYFHLKGVEQRLLPCEISYNALRSRSEIQLRLEDVRQSGVSFAPDPAPEEAHATPADGSTPVSSVGGFDIARAGYVNYRRPFVDAAAHELVLEIGGES
ncbi:hypothetical protein EJ06DRAFT_551993 [Trichodelitschia bisporula]|uniref:Potassium channel tetramerisation-type BTB domain-containing protein n=1 Tax=Trichodelitschia bisporula TaxID=703511 RepID=A0A6G1HJK1_9PEZI|nr:hypothetical protein EJ06DRAFT_551993 [Trichodelitschia bisporula]